jgi:hypothetical protein
VRIITDTLFMIEIATAKNTSEQEHLQYYADASDIRIPPGPWPNEIGTTFGNRQPFRITRGAEKVTSDVAFYEQPGTGIMLTVFND